MSQLVRMVRIQLVNWKMVLGLPLLIVAIVAAGNMLIASAIDTGGEGMSTGGLLSIYVTMLMAYVQTMTHVFPFVVGMSVTRRTFFAGTSLLIVGQALLYGLILTVARYVEEATDGWGLDLGFFALPFLTEDNPALQLLVFTVPLLLMSFIGVGIGIVFKRWGQVGVWSVAISFIVLVIGFTWLVSWQRWWGQVGDFFSSQSTVSLLVGYPIVLTLVVAGAAFAITRRTVP